MKGYGYIKVIMEWLKNRLAQLWPIKAVASAVVIVLVVSFSTAFAMGGGS